MLAKDKPIIGLTTNIEMVRDNESYTLYLSYPEAIKRAGGIPVVLTLGDEEMAQTWVSMCDGILMTGGMDITPSFYGAEPAYGLGPTNPSLDASDFRLIEEAGRKGIPLFGICRGSQLINVAFGGTMIQDIQTEISGAVDHLHFGNRFGVLNHDIIVEKNSTLYRVLQEEIVAVNSFHHQAICRLGEGLVPMARSADGIIEAFESRDGRIMGTQFHPEEMQKFDDRMFELMKIFVDKCRFGSFNHTLDCIAE